MITLTVTNTIARPVSLASLTEALRRVLPVANPLVDHYRNQGLLDQAILESLATFDDVHAALPIETREQLQLFLKEDGVSPKFQKRAQCLLGRIPMGSQP